MSDETNPANAKLEKTAKADVAKANAKSTSEFKRERANSAFLSKSASNIQIALPKTREPGQSFIDKNIPHQVNDPEQLERLWDMCRLYYSTHDLVPLLVDIYSQFPLSGLELTSKDPEIKEFYEDMFFNELEYEEFLPEAIGREYFVVGEVTTLAHFSESLGIWTSEEVLDPRQLLVTKSMFVQRERIQLLVKEQVEALRDGPRNASIRETPSQEKERRYQYQQLVEHYPEFIAAAAQDDGVDLSDVLTSRIVNRAFKNDLRGTPHMLRSMRTLSMEEEIHAAQDAVASRMYSPLILAKLGLPSLGPEGPWLPGQEELDAVRDDLQAAMAADFKLMVGNVGLEISSVFGREILPRFNEDYERIDAKILQAWGIGQALIAGGTSNGGAYASSALNREFASNLMSNFQKKVTRHILRRAEVVAEAWGHYDYELKGGIRRPIYRNIIKTHEDGTEEKVRVPKLLLPEVKWRTLNLRDEKQEREFLGMLKEAGVPISDKALSVNIDIEFDEELEKQADETVKKQMAQAQAMEKVKILCDEQSLAYPAELAQFLMQTIQIRQGLAGTSIQEGQAKMQEMQLKQMMPAGQMGLLPGTQPQPGVPSPGNPTGAQPPGVPQAAPPGAEPPGTDGPPAGGGGQPASARQRQRPADSDEQRGSMPIASRFGKAPSTLGRLERVSERDVKATLKQRDLSRGVPKVSALVEDPDFYIALNLQDKEGQIRSEYKKQGRKSSLIRDAITQYEETYGVEPTW